MLQLENLTILPHRKHVTSKTVPLISNVKFCMSYNRGLRVMACLCKSKVLFYTLKSSQYPFDGAKCEVIEIHVLALLNMATCNFIVHKAEIVETILVCRVWAIFRNGWSSVFRAGKEKCSKVEILVSPQAINNINSDYENFAILLWLQQKSQNHQFKYS